MRSLWRMWGVLACACVCACALGGAQAQRIDQDAMVNPRPRARDRDRDAAKPDEPTCDQLKAMWRFSKRQARAPELMNEVNSYRDPMMFNQWPVYTAIPRAAPRFRYQYASTPRETYGRVVTKAPPNVVRTPDYDEMYGMLNVPQTSGKILRYPGPSRPRNPFMEPPQKNRFDTLKNIIRQEHIRELQRKYETEQKQELKELTSGRGITGDDDGYYGEQEPRGLQPVQLDYSADEPTTRQHKKPPSGRQQVAQFSRYSDVMLPPSRRSSYPPYFQYAGPDFVPFAY